VVCAGRYGSNGQYRHKRNVSIFDHAVIGTELEVGRQDWGIVQLGVLFILGCKVATETCYLGIDAGTQGLSVVVIDSGLNVVAKGEGLYEMVSGLSDGCYEQRPSDWEEALRSAMVEVSRVIHGKDWVVSSIGISGQMHGEVLLDRQHRVLSDVRLWCDSRNEAEGAELTELLGVKIPKRMTAARWLWTVRQRPELAHQVARITTPAGWLSHRLNGQFDLGIGDASGMFPVDWREGQFDRRRLEQFESLQRQSATPESLPLSRMLPRVVRAGGGAGSITAAGSKILGLQPGIPIAAAEGDQPAALAGSKISRAGSVSVSFGTSVCANAIGDREFQGVHAAIDHFCSVDGLPINMVFLRNGTTFMNAIVNLFTGSSRVGFAELMRDVVAVPLDCGGVVALPFMDDEPGMGINRTEMGSLLGINQSNATPANFIRAALVAAVMNLKMGLEVLAKQGFAIAEIVLTGGLTRTPELGQVLADFIGAPVRIPEQADEGTAFGAALLARYRFEVSHGSQLRWSEFLASLPCKTDRQFLPNPLNQSAVDDYYQKYRKYCKRSQTPT
jgi:L-ribulokinase